VFDGEKGEELIKEIAPRRATQGPGDAENKKKQGLTDDQKRMIQILITVRRHHDVE